MKTATLEEVYVEKLKDLYDAEEQIVKGLPKMAKAASTPALQEAFEKHLEQTKGQIMRLDKIFESLGASADGKQCVGMRGLLEEGEELLSEQQAGPALDAALIAAAQSVEHYEMAGYGSAQTWARQLGYGQAADLLEETLEEEEQTDQDLTEIAETLVNPDAGGDADEEDEDEEIEGDGEAEVEMEVESEEEIEEPEEEQAGKRKKK